MKSARGGEEEEKGRGKGFHSVKINSWPCLQHVTLSYSTYSSLFLSIANFILPGYFAHVDEDGDDDSNEHLVV